LFKFEANDSLVMLVMLVILHSDALSGVMEQAVIQALVSEFTGKVW
jgi:hypothetical protein